MVVCWYWFYTDTGWYTKLTQERQTTAAAAAKYKSQETNALLYLELDGKKHKEAQVDLVFVEFFFSACFLVLY